MIKNSKTWYLRENVYFEPLFNHWYAWSYLIPPVTAARHLTNTHKRIMTSFINNYELHMMAVKDKRMAGAEFLNCTEDEIPKIKSLLEEMEEKCADLVDLSNAVAELDQLLREHTSGESVDSLYLKVPEILQGYVELYFDMEHRASYRFIEPLLYDSPLYKRSLQSVSFGLITKGKERPFVLSTPRLPDQSHLQLAMDFNDPVLEAIFRSRDVPLDDQQFKELTESINGVGGLALNDLFTEDMPKNIHEPVKNGVRISYTGHAGFLIETQSLSILIDPVIASRGEDYSDEVISFSQLPAKIDYVCITHNHQDHNCLETLLQLRHKIGSLLLPKNNGGTLADPSMKLLLRQFGFEVSEYEDLDEVSILDGKIVAIPFLGEHGDLNIRSKTGWYVELLGRKLYFGADSSNPDKKLYERLGERYSDIDVLAIGMECVGAPYTWVYGALYTRAVSKSVKESRRLNGSDSIQAIPMVEAFGAKQVFIYALGMEPWYKYFMGIEYDDDSKQVIESKKMLNACKDMGVDAEALFGKKIIHLSSLD